MRTTIVLLCLVCSPSALAKGRFVSKGAVAFDESQILSQHEPAEVAEVLMQTEAGLLLGDNVLATFEKELDQVKGMAKEPGKRFATVRNAVTVKRRGQSLILDVEVAFDDASVAKFVCTKLLTGFLEARVERRTVMAERRLVMIDEELKTAKGARAEALKDERLAEERKLRDRFNEVRVLVACSDP